MLTPNDIKNPKRQSGYNFVTRTGVAGTKGHGGGKPWVAKKRLSKEASGPVAVGPVRVTPLEAAQDYCNYVNSGRAPQPASLKTAGHKRPQQPKPRVPSDIAAARGMIRDYEAQRRRGVQGYVYCISDGTAAKIGYSVNPQKRVLELQTGNPRILTLLGYIKGTEADERKLHRKYRKDNILQEWFHPSEALLVEFGIKKGAKPA